MKIWSVLVPALLLAVAQSAAAQSSGSLRGTVLESSGATIPDAPIRARNAATGTDARTRSADDGSYEFTDLPAGTYLVTLNMPCCRYWPYVNDAVTVEAGRNELDIELADGSLSVEGDDIAIVNEEILSRQVVPDLPVPRMADGRPDLSGVWLPQEDPYPEDPKLLEWAGKVMEERVDNWFIDLPSTHCLPGTLPIPSGASLTAKFVQTPDVIVILFEDVGGFRQVFLDGRGHPDDPEPTWLGHSIGRWEGDTLVVDTVGLNDRGWTEFFPRTEQLHLVERYRRTDYGHLEATITYEDPGVFEAPFTRHTVWPLAPQLELMEYVCENNPWQDAGQ
jgi:Carboxypeptidase regulatory-like domain